METKATDLFKDQLIGEEVYFGKPEDRPEPHIGDRCWVKEDDGELHEHEVVLVFKKTFDTKAIDGEPRHCVGIKKRRFRKKD